MRFDEVSLQTVFIDEPMLGFGHGRRLPAGVAMTVQTWELRAAFAAAAAEACRPALPRLAGGKAATEAYSLLNERGSGAVLSFPTRAVAIVAIVRHWALLFCMRFGLSTESVREFARARRCELRCGSAPFAANVRSNVVGMKLSTVPKPFRSDGHN